MLEDIVFLYVEDDPNSRKVMNLLMTKFLKVKALFLFEDSTDFENRLRDLDPIPEIILLDIQVYPLDGFDMLKIIRQTPKLQQSKVIALTASVMNEEVERLRTAGFDGTISKPLSMSNFPTLIHRIANGESVWYIA